MAVRMAVLALASLAVFAQQLPRTAVVGTIERISSGEIRVNAGAESITFRVDSGTEVWKGGTHDDLAVLRVGDEVSVHAVKEASGGLTARSVSAQRITFRAVVREVDRATSAIVTAPRTDPTRIGGADSRIVHYFPNTAFSTSARGLAVGQEISVEGLGLQNGAVDATRITIYNTDLPATRFRSVPPRR
jgi:hypothetical protein